MNTITITSKTDEQGNAQSAVIYSEGEVLRFIEKAEQLNATDNKVREIKHQVRDFFSELEWEGSEATITRSDVNELLRSINIEQLRSEFKALVTITAYVSGYTATDADDAESCIADDIELNIGSGADISIDYISVDEVEEE